MPNYKRYYVQGYPYIFITMVTYNRQKILIDNIDLLRYAFKKTLQNYNYEIVAICVLQDHIHMIIKDNNIGNYSNIIGSIKKIFTYNIKNKPNKEHLTKSMIKRKECGIWQRRFYEHTIRDEKDFNIHIDYIHYNPYKHYNISPKNWEYSSFKKFVNLGYYDLDWCDYNGDLVLE